MITADRADTASASRPRTIDQVLESARRRIVRLTAEEAAQASRAGAVVVDAVRVDVVAADSGGEARVVAAGARVTGVPDTGTTDTGALVVLSVPRATAARLAGAGTTSRLAVTLR